MLIKIKKERFKCLIKWYTVDELVGWPSGLRRQLKALVRKGVGSNPTSIIFYFFFNYYNNFIYYNLIAKIYIIS